MITLADFMLRKRPKSNAPTPFGLISNDSKEVEKMEKAARNPEILVVSDWSNITSDDYFQGMVDSKLDIL